MKLVESSHCSQCRTVDETPFHFFSACPVTLKIWEELKKWLKPRDTVASFDSTERHPRYSGRRIARNR